MSANLPRGLGVGRWHNFAEENRFENGDINNYGDFINTHFGKNSEIPK